MKVKNMNDINLIQALYCELSLEDIKKIITNGADICSKRVLPRYDEYPLTIAIEQKLNIEYVKLLDNDTIPPVYKFWLIKHFKPSEEIIVYLLENISKFIKNDKYLQEWNVKKFESSFFERAQCKQSKIFFEAHWNQSPMKQIISRAIRCDEHKNLH